MESEMGNLVRYTFRPKDEEIISLLNKKKLNPDFYVQIINEIDVYNFEPFDLPRLSSIQSDEFVWYFFCASYAKHSNSKRVSRRTSTGYWKVTGKGRTIFSKRGKEVIGSKKVLVFCEQSDASKKYKGEWVMHEFCSQYNSPHKEDFVICRIERKTYNKPKISTGDDRQSSQHLASKFKNHVAENNYPKVEFQLPDQSLASDYRNHVAENPPPRDDRQSSHHLASHSRNNVAENTFPWAESQLLPRHHLVSDFRDQVAEHSVSMEKSLLQAQFDILRL